MKLFPPQSEVTLYKTGFAGEPKGLNRNKEAKQLSELVERIEDPMVVAVDGPWGSGKTHFLKRWVGAHQNENSGRARTIYFDAFASDYLDDPLIALTGAISDRLESNGVGVDFKKLRQAAIKLASPLARIGLAVTTAGLSEFAGPLVDAAVKEAGNTAKNSSDAFWAHSNDRRAAMDTFREALVALTKIANEDSETLCPLVIVIDELDRCRPDYALSLLEVLKHFFAVPAVHFVLGVNVSALQLSVKARYGASIDAHDYLKRFITLTMALAEQLDEIHGSAIQLNYYDSAANGMEIEPSTRDIFRKHLKWIVADGSASLRDVERILTNIALMPDQNFTNRLMLGWQEILVSLVVMKVLNPGLFRQASKGNLDINDVRNFYGFRNEHINRLEESNPDYSHDAFILNGLWNFLISNGTEPKEDLASFARQFDSFRESPGKLDHVVHLLRRDHIDRFILVE